MWRDRDIRAKTNNRHNIDDVARALIHERRVDLEDLREAAESAADRKLKVFESPLLR